MLLCICWNSLSLLSVSPTFLHNSNLKSFSTRWNIWVICGSVYIGYFVFDCISDFVVSRFLWSFIASQIEYITHDALYMIALPNTAFQKQTEMLITSNQFHLDQSQMTLFINCGLLSVSREWNLSWNTTSFPFVLWGCRRLCFSKSALVLLQFPVFIKKKKKVLQEKTSRRWKLAPCWRCLHVPICHAHSTQQLKATRASLSPQVIYLILTSQLSVHTQIWQIQFTPMERGCWGRAVCLCSLLSVFSFSGIGTFKLFASAALPKFPRVFLLEQCSSGNLHSNICYLCVWVLSLQVYLCTMCVPAAPRIQCVRIPWVKSHVGTGDQTPVLCQNSKCC